MRKVLRQYQEEFKASIYEAWDTGARNVLGVKPTGMGKALSICSIAIDMAVTPQNKMPTVIAVHRKELVQQLSLTLAEEGVVHNIIAPRPTILGIIAAQRRILGKQFYDYNAPITVVSVDTLNARIKVHAKWAEGIRLWIVDEAAHLLKDNKWGQTVSYFPNAIGLGVTACPQRLDKRGLGRHADGVFDVMIEGPTTKWGITNGFLSNYKIAVPKSDYQDHLTKAAAGADYSKQAMAHASSASHIVGDVVDNYIKFADGKQAIVFASDLDAAKKMEDKFNERGIPAKFLHAGSGDKERLDGIIDFRDKKTRVLINVDLFDEGLDVPGIECVIHARPTKSLSKYRQMNGRGLRPMKGKEFLIIIDHVGNVKEHGLPCDVTKWTLDRIVKRRDKVNLIRICANFTCNSPFSRLLNECPWCGEPVYKAPPGSGGGGRVSLKTVDGDLFLLDPDTLRELMESANLESPGSVGARVAHAAGGPAGIKAAKNQIERIDTQKALSEILALWAGKKRHEGFTDRQIHKLFYIENEQTITHCLSEPKKEMLASIARLKEELGMI